MMIPSSNLLPNSSTSSSSCRIGGDYDGVIDERGEGENQASEQEPSSLDTFGIPHLSLQQFDARDYPPRHEQTWKGSKGVMVPSDIRTWFPLDDGPAFHIPINGGSRYATMTYHDLHANIEKCPMWRKDVTSTNCDDNPFVIAILLPLNWMTETAIVELCVMSGGSKPLCHSTAAAPLDPRMNRESILQALDQLDCRGIVTTNDLLESKVYGGEGYDYRRLCEIRTVQRDVTSPGCVIWTSVVSTNTGISVEVNNNTSSLAPVNKQSTKLEGNTPVRFIQYRYCLTYSRIYI